MDNGAEASGAVVETIVQHLRWADRLDDQEAQYLARLRAAVSDANDRLIQDACQSAQKSRRGSTLSMAWVAGSVAYFAHIGDSRAYLVRDGDLRQLTHDHSVVQDLIDTGQLQQVDRRDHSQRHMITRALGIDRIAQCDIFVEHLRVGDRLLFCTDGLSNVLSDNEIHAIVSQVRGRDECVSALVNSALRAHTDDNVSAVVVDMHAPRED